MLSPNIYLALWIWGLAAIVVAYFFLVRARRYFVEPQGLSLLRRGLARYVPSNYTSEGVVLIRRALVSLVVLALSFVACLIIYWARFGARR